MNASNNTENYVTLSNLSADSNGEITIEVAAGENASFAYLNGVIIESQVTAAMSSGRMAISDTPNLLFANKISVYPNPS